MDYFHYLAFQLTHIRSLFNNLFRQTSAFLYCFQVHLYPHNMKMLLTHVFNVKRYHQTITCVTLVISSIFSIKGSFILIHCILLRPISCAIHLQISKLFANRGLEKQFGNFIMKFLVNWSI